MPPTEVAGARRWKFARFELDERTLTLSQDGVAVALRRKPMQVLLYLVQRSGEVVTKDELAEVCWPRRVLSESVLATTVNRLRAVLGDDAQEVVRTVHGFGYRIGVHVALQHDTVPLAQRLTLKAGDHPPLRPMWRLVQQLGAGGSADVWMAEHDKTHERRVYKFAVDADALRGLKREITLQRVLRDTLGERSDLVRILDWNLEQVPCFLESEYIDAGSLPTWSEAQGGLAAVPLSRRLALMAQCADALSAAHSVGVLHKDLKPANVLVIDAGVDLRIKLGDFGSGAMQDSTKLNALGITRLGFSSTRAFEDSSGSTPLYTPPEVLRGQPATLQGDVFALGVMLYQAVVADWSRPLAPGWERDVDDPLLREDIAGAVDGEPQRRFSDAADLARRLRSLDERRAERARSAETLRAQARQAQELAQSEIRRRYLLATVGVLVIGLAGSLFLALKLWNSERARTVALASARQEAEVADQVTKYVVSLFDAATPENAAGKPIDPKMLLARGDALITDGFSDPRVRARMLETVGTLYCKLGYPDPCRKDVSAALDIERTRPQDEPIVSARLFYWQAQADLAAGHFPQAEVEMNQSLRIVRVAGPDANPSLAAVLLGSGVIARDQYQAVPSVALLEEARGVLEARHEQASPLYVQVLGALALSYQDAERERDALKVGQYAMTLGSAHGHQDGPEYLEALEQFASVMSNLDHNTEAVVAFRRVVAGYREVFGSESRRTLQAQGDFAICLMAIGHFREAQQAAEAALASERLVDRPGSPAYVDAVTRVGRILFYRGDYEASLPFLRETYRNALSQNQPTDADLITAGYDLARPLLYLRRFTEARALLSAQMPADKTDDYAKYMRTMRTRWLGELEMQAGNLAEAERLLGEAEQQFAGFKSAGGAVITSVRESHGWLMNLRGRHSQALAQLQQVSDDYGQIYPADSAFVQIANVHRAAALLALNQKDAARQLITGAKSVVEAELVPGAEARKVYAQVARAL